MKAVLISIKPKWCELIASGEKTAEVRKSRPKLETPFKCYIYCTNGQSEALWRYRGEYYYDQQFPNERPDKANGKIIGEFVCNEILTAFQCNSGWIWENARIPQELFFDYLGIPRGTHFGYEKKAYAWRISDLVVYSKPKELSEFRKPCVNDLFCENCALYSNPLERCGNVGLIITRPPQSWCYVEELRGENYGN